ncbi:hypothetical protein FB45DRAFT_352450 [Roridomyces roridus]|uniref:Uncharacterized protein n=1 Tax=Roridomyces roridus TaxID=1738132 RepID=A0AAD7FVW2_9AGAR|nr:hypothetical protein FB45DRAFT_352450 [Roridomyces roridus]
MKMHLNSPSCTVKVGGRRHSINITMKHRPRPPVEPAQTDPAPEPEPVTDYPRPVAPTEAHVPPPHNNNNEEEAPRKDKKQDLANERKLLELAQRKAEMARPTRDAGARGGGGKGFGGAGRISQPMKPVHI